MKWFFFCLLACVAGFGLIVVSVNQRMQGHGPDVYVLPLIGATLSAAFGFHALFRYLKDNA